jgi:RNA polymerase sigma-70 factor, ECF subfamily
MTHGAIDAAASSPRLEDETLPFEDLYKEHFAFVWRNVRRLGVPDALVDDAVQEVFLVVHRRLPEFEGRSSLRTWIFGVVARVASHHRRSLRRREPEGRLGQWRVDADGIADDAAVDPYDHTERNQSNRLLRRMLDALDDKKRAVFVLAEMEQMSAPEIAEALGINVNTASARLRAARQEINEAVARERARDGWRFR